MKMEEEAEVNFSRVFGGFGNDELSRGMNKKEKKETKEKRKEET